MNFPSFSHFFAEYIRTSKAKSQHRKANEGRVRAHRHRRRGFTLLEMMLALVVFSLSIGSLTQSILLVMQITNDNRRHIQIVNELQNLLADQKLLTFGQGEQELESRIPGVTFSMITEPLDLKNYKGETLSGLFKITIKAVWLEGRETVTEEAEVYVNQS